MQHQKHKAARAALAGLLANEVYYKNVVDSCVGVHKKVCKAFAEDSYDMAESMIEEAKHRDPNFDERQL